MYTPLIWTAAANHDGTRLKCVQHMLNTHFYENHEIQSIILMKPIDRITCCVLLAYVVQCIG